ncbi:secondary thiamine-phosphate synthase enzyme YjbQ [Streptomyces sp. NPDC050636]|uniref:secondary thiamine-phosphate synthase enzyme YjbQ n=1 Tax=Streptomyces sp. NPDC050636 TaxID=3154510 RepID=UPI003431D80D
MATISDTRIRVVSHDVLPAGSSIAVSVRFSVTIDTPEDSIDLTDELRRLVAESGVTEGTLHVYCGHTTCGLTINENECGLATDMKAVLERIAPHSSTHYYAHDKKRTPAERAVHSERDNGHSHARALLATHPELNIPITASKLYLGRWQAIMMAEFDGPRTRELLVRVHRA